MLESVLKSNGTNQAGNHSIVTSRLLPDAGSRAAVARSSRPHWLQFILDQNPESRVCLAESVAREIFLHLAMNLDPRYARDTAQILILNGAYGVGKTVSVEETLTRCGCGIVRIQASELESELAGAPAKTICLRYLKASQCQEEKKRPYALVIEDIHLAFSVNRNTYNTQNLHQTIGTLMGICDYPHQVGGACTHRIPIFMTTNNLTRVCGGLIRPGRSRVFAVELTAAERERIISHLLSGFLKPAQITYLCASRPDWSIAAFRQLRSELLRRSFDEQHRGRTPQEILQASVIAPPNALGDGHRAGEVDNEQLHEAARAIDREADAKRDFTEESVGADSATG